MKILLTGANGQLGRALQMALKHHHVVALAHDPIDITQLDQVLAAVQYHRPRLTTNAAAFNDVDGAESRCDEAFGSTLWGHEIWRLPRPHTGSHCSKGLTAFIVALQESDA
jgi:dTDP-4-dehydrorhamnose reductase